MKQGSVPTELNFSCSSWSCMIYHSLNATQKLQEQVSVVSWFQPAKYLITIYDGYNLLILKMNNTAFSLPELTIHAYQFNVTQNGYILQLSAYVLTLTMNYLLTFPRMLWRIKPLLGMLFISSMIT